MSAPTDLPIPRKPDPLAVWIYDNGPITAIRVEYRQTGVDTADTFCHLTGWWTKKTTRECRPDHLQNVADLRLDFNSILCLKCGQREAIETWRAYEKKHASELADYRRLRAKYG